MTLIKHELKSNLKTLLVWSLTIGGMALAFMLMFPSMQDSLNKMGDMYSNMKGFSEAFGLDKLSIYTPMGFYGTEVGAVLSLGGALFGALLGAGMLSKEEGGHTAEFLLTAPIRRGSVICQKLAAMSIIIFLFNVICISCAFLSFLIIGEKLEMKEFLLYHFAQFCMHLEIGFICFCISSFFKKVNVGLGLGIAIILYFMDIMVKIIPDLKNLKYFTPFNYAGAGDIFAVGKIDSTLLAIGILTSIVVILLSFIQYMNKDIAA